MSSLPASMKRIRSKTAEKMWWRSFRHYKSMGIFSDAQGQLTLLSVVGSGWISNSCKLLCMSLLPASIKRIRSKTVEKTWWRPFPHYNPMGAICCHGKQSSDLICIKADCSLSPTPMMLQIKFGCNWPAGLGDIHVWKCGCTDARTDAWTPARVPSYKLTKDHFTGTWPWIFKSKETYVHLREMSQLMRLWNLSNRQPAKAQASLPICTAVLPESSLLAHMQYGSRRRVRPKFRHLAPPDGCTCGFEELVYGGRKEP